MLTNFFICLHSVIKFEIFRIKKYFLGGKPPEGE
jgi:hypothetical protein